MVLCSQPRASLQEEGWLQGEEPGRDRQGPRTSPWECGVQQEAHQQGKRVAPRLERRANISCLADCPGSHTCSVTSMGPHPQKAQPLSFRIHVNGSVPLLHFQVSGTPGLCSPELCLPGGGHHVPHSRIGRWPRGGPHRLCLHQSRAAAPGFPKQQASWAGAQHTQGSV